MSFITVTTFFLVFGGIYILRKTARSVILEPPSDADDVIVNEESQSPNPQQSRARVKGIICTGGMRFSTKWLVAEASYAPDNWIAYGAGKSGRDSVTSLAVLEANTEAELILIKKIR